MKKRFESRLKANKVKFSVDKGEALECGDFWPLFFSFLETKSGEN
jgi:hypothetical protein